MTDMLMISFIIALMIQFIHACSWEGMLLGWLNGSLWNLTPYLRKPLFDCPICMSPWWGSLFIVLLWAAGCIGLPGFGQWILTLLMVGGINTLIVLIARHE